MDVPAISESAKKKSTPAEKEAMTNAFCGAAAELLFVALPLLVIALVLRYKHLQPEILKSPEWAFAAAVLFGQGLVKLVAQIAERGGIHGDRIGLFFAIILVLGLVPSLVILSLIFLTPHPGSGLVTAQMTLFAASAFTFFVCSGLAALARADPPKKNA